MQLAPLYYLELSLPILHNYRITTFVNLWLTPLKYQKVEKQQQQNRYLIIKKAYDCVGKIHGPQLLQSPKVTTNLKSIKIFSLKQ